MLRTLWGSLQALFAFFSLGTARFAAYLRKARRELGLRFAWR